MSEWRGVVIQLALIAALTAMVLKAADPMVIHSGVAIIGTAIGTAVMRARSEQNALAGGAKPGAKGTSFPPIIGGIVGGVLALVVGSLALHGCAPKPSPAEQARVDAYALELLACPALAFAKYGDAGLDASIECRLRVERAYGRLDGGAQ